MMNETERATIVAAHTMYLALKSVREGMWSDNTIKEAIETYEYVAEHGKLPTKKNLSHQDVLNKVQNMTSDEFKQSLVDAGIITTEGKLTEQYK